MAQTENRKVALIPPAVDLGGFRATRPVKGPTQWKSMGHVLNWLTGRGGQLVNAGPDRVGTFTHAFTFYVWPRSPHSERVWTISLIRRTNEAAFGTFQAPTGTEIGKWNMSASDPDGIHIPKLFAFQENIPSPSSTPGAITAKLVVDTQSDATVDIVGISCFELPRAFLDVAGAEGVDAATLAKGQPVYAGTGSGESVGELWAQGQDLDITTGVARRNKLFDFHRRVGSGLSITTASFSGTSNILAVNPPVLNRHMQDTSTTRNAAWTVFADVTNGTTTGEVKVTATSGATSTITVTSTIETWTSVKTFAIDTEHISRLTTDGGIRDGTRDRLRFEGRVASGAGTLRLFGISVGEP